MLKLIDIVKNYKVADSFVPALKNVSLQFRKNEFVSILGASGCGKTTLLNIIGGLDRYTSGDLQVDGISTKEFKVKDWDLYRNRHIGFVFQNYNLIPHLTVLDNVVMSLQIAGFQKKAREQKAKEVLEKVGLGSEISKKPNQLSGGQMQRVAIARALVNNPDIILADEPTGALDTETGIQVMEILKVIAKEKLVIMVTHNPELANEYSSRIIKISDGEILSDSNPIDENENQLIVKQSHIKSKIIENNSGKKQNAVSYVDANYNTNHNKEKNKNEETEDLENKKTKRKKEKVSMSYFTALKLSFKNLFSKKGRTIITSIASSIGILGVALVLAISSGMTNYVNKTQTSTLANFPISIAPIAMLNVDEQQDKMMQPGGGKFTGFELEDILKPYEMLKENQIHTNMITEDYIKYVDGLDKKLYSDIMKQSLLQMNLITKTQQGEFVQLKNETELNFSDKERLDVSDFLGMLENEIGWQQLPSQNFLKEQYDLLAGDHYPNSTTDLALIVDKQNFVDVKLLESLGFEIGKDFKYDDKLKFDKILGQEIKLAFNDDFYINQGNNIFKKNENLKGLFESDKGVKLKISSIIRIKEDSASMLLKKGLGYTKKLVEVAENNAKDSQIAKVVIENPLKPIFADDLFDIKTLSGEEALAKYNFYKKSTGADTIPVSINIYPKNFESKPAIKSYLDKYNEGKEQFLKIEYMDIADSFIGVMKKLINIVTSILIAFAAISLVVSTIMIGIITYVSVVERTKEIGVLRSLGARRLDISRVFSSEAIIIGALSGVLGIILCYLISIPINILIEKKYAVAAISNLPFYFAIALIALSVLLTFLGGLIPALIASKKDPVKALRSE